MHRKICLLLLAVLAGGPFVTRADVPAGKRAMTFEDMMAFKRVGEPIPSPDGKWVVFDAVDVNLAENAKRTHLWIVPAAGGESRRLNPGSDHDESRARFSPDGKRLIFISKAGDAPQVWMSGFNADTGTLAGMPHASTAISTGADGAIWSPDGNDIVFISEVYPDAANDAANRERDETLKKSKVKAQIFTRLFYRHWNAFTEFKRSHLFVVSANSDFSTPSTVNPTVPPRDLTPGDHDVPPFSLGGSDDYAISPDGKELAYTSNIDEVEATSTNNEIFLVPLAGGEPKKISVSPGSDSTPRYSPDGKWIAWRSQARGGYESDKFSLVIYDRQTGEIHDAAPHFDRWVDSFAWTADSKAVFLTAEDHGLEPIYALPVTGVPVEPEELAKVQGGDLALSSDGKTLFFSRTRVNAPAEIASLPVEGWRNVAKVRPEVSGGGQEPANGSQQPTVQVRIDPTAAASAGLNPEDVRKTMREVIGVDAVLTTGTAAKAVTHMNDPLLSQLDLPPLESFNFKGAEDATVQGFLLRPPGFDEKKKYPLKFLIHGGPQGAWGDSWSFRWNAELFAATGGYVVVMINPHGSTGYGQAFTDGVNGDWGGKPYVDLMKGLDYVEQTYPFIDKNREAALGASYGGYMVNWILGHTDRFKCAVSHDGLFNAEAAYGATEELWFNEWEYKGTPWDNPETYQKWSPDRFAKNFKTPTLVVHGQLDYRLDVSQGFALFTTLQRLHVPSKMLYFPDEGHWVLKPQNSQLWNKTVNDWVDQWTGAGTK